MKTKSLSQIIKDLTKHRCVIASNGGSLNFDHRIISDQELTEPNSLLTKYLFLSFSAEDRIWITKIKPLLDITNELAVSICTCKDRKTSTKQLLIRKLLMNVGKLVRDFLHEKNSVGTYMIILNKWIESRTRSEPIEILKLAKFVEAQLKLTRGGALSPWILLNIVFSEPNPSLV